MLIFSEHHFAASSAYFRIIWWHFLSDPSIHTTQLSLRRAEYCYHCLSRTARNGAARLNDHHEPKTISLRVPTLELSSIYVAFGMHLSFPISLWPHSIRQASTYLNKPSFYLMRQYLVCAIPTVPRLDTHRPRVLLRQSPAANDSEKRNCLASRPQGWVRRI